MPGRAAGAQPPVAGPAPEPPREYRGLTGVKAITAANREATVEPDDASMRGATWYIEDVQPSLIYRSAPPPGRVTTILLPPGERFNGAVGGDVERFLINVAYAGPRPAVSILPREAGRARQPPARHHRRLLLFTARPARETALNLVDVARTDAARGRRRLGAAAARGRLHAAGARARGRAAARLGAGRGLGRQRKMVVRFDGPLPVLPTLLAGRKGEQVVSYRSVADGRQVYLVTVAARDRGRAAARRPRASGSRSIPPRSQAGAAADPAQGRGRRGGRRRARSRRRRPSRPTRPRPRASRWPTNPVLGVPPVTPAVSL